MLNRKEIPTLIAEIKDELAKLEKLVERLAKKQARIDDEEFSDSAALRLHNFYTGCERIFKLIAKEVNGVLSQDFDWHKRLLSQMALEIPHHRPAVISTATRTALEELLGFRHIVRNLYVYELKPERVEELVNVALNLHPRLAQEIKNFIAFLENIYQQS